MQKAIPGDRPLPAQSGFLSFTPTLGQSEQIPLHRAVSKRKDNRVDNALRDEKEVDNGV